MRMLTATALLAAALGCAAPAAAQISGNVVRIGVLGDQSGMASDSAGKGSVLAAQMAVQDFGGKVGNAAIEILHADSQGKPDVASSVVRRWFDVDGVDAVADVPFTSVALAVNAVAASANRTVLIASAASSDLTGKACQAVTTQWSDDSYALSVGAARAIVKDGGSSWYFITADYTFGHALERDATRSIEQSGGKVVGSVRHPLNTADFSSYLVHAQGSGARIVAFASVGTDTIVALKQAAEFGLAQGGQRLAPLLVFLTDIHSLGLAAAQGSLIAEGFYWDQNDAARTWSRRFLAAHGKMPTKAQAAAYVSVLHYLRAVEAVGTDEARAVNARMRQMPVDYFGRPATIRPSGRVVYDLSLYQVKAPAESRQAWDYYRQVGIVPADQAFRPMADEGCPLNRN